MANRAYVSPPGRRRGTSVAPAPVLPSRTAGAATIAAAALRPYRRLLGALPDERRGPIERRTGASLERAGLSWPDVAEQPELRVPYDACVEMLEAAVALTGLDALGLYAAEAWREGDFDLCECLIRSAGTIGDAIEAMRRYLPLVVDADFEVVRDGRWLIGRLCFAPDLEIPGALVDQVMATIRLLTLRYAPDSHALRVELHLARPRPTYADEYARILQLEPAFGRSHDAFVFPMELCALPMRDADRVLFAVLRRQADTEMSALRRHASLAHRVRDAIADALPRGGPLSAVAREIGIGPQTLQRRLLEQGTTYRVLVEQVRRDLASRLLEEPRCSMSEIAYRLGFSQPPSFHRAFKRWFGRGPSEYREALRHRLGE